MDWCTPIKQLSVFYSYVWWAHVLLYTHFLLYRLGLQPKIIPIINYSDGFSQENDKRKQWKVFKLLILLINSSKPRDYSLTIRNDKGSKSSHLRTWTQQMFYILLHQFHTDHFFNEASGLFGRCVKGGTHTHNDNQADFAPILPLPDHRRLSSVL